MHSMAGNFLLLCWEVESRVGGCEFGSEGGVFLGRVEGCF